MMTSKGYAHSGLLVSPVQLAGLLRVPADGPLLLDLRPAEAFAAGHVPGGVHLDLFGLSLIDTSPAPLRAFLHMIQSLLASRGVSEERTVIVYDDRSGVRAARAFWLLEYFGHPDARLLDGGFVAWSRAGLPVTRTAEPAEPARWTPRPTPDRLATWRDVRERLWKPDACLLDVRSGGEFRGTDVRAKRGGSIPGAVHLEWVRTLDEDGAFRSGGELRALFEAAGVTPDREVVAYCQGGYRAAHTYVALRLLGYPRVRNYLGSWKEWGDRDDLPVHTTPIVGNHGEGAPMNSSVIDFIHASRDRYLIELKDLLAIPSISALPAHAADVRRCAEWMTDEMRRIGLQHVRLMETPGNPVVYGDWLGVPGAPTILYYGHYDVQPVDPLDLWLSPPFEPTIREGEIFARGAADDKGQVFMHLKAVEAWIKQTGGLPVNIKMFIEGEEEVGSRHLDTIVRDSREQLAADVVVISDTPMFDRETPSICYGLRGLAYCQIDLRGTTTDLHSGQYGGAVANPAFVLGQILAQMKDRGGRVKIPGFYEDVRPLSDAERAEWRKLRYNEARWRREIGAPKLFGESGYTTFERIWGRPTFEVNGLLSGFTGEGAKTVIPAVAMAKVSMRLVPDQEPDKVSELFESYVRKVAPRTVELRVTRMHGGKPWMTAFDNPFVRAAGRAIEQGFGKAPVFTREGGSIPVVQTFQDVLGVPSVLFGIGLPDDRIHAPNEKLDLANFHNGVVASAFLYREMAAARALERQGS